MNTFRISALALAMALVLAVNSFASAQCNAGRQIDTTNLNLGLQAAPVTGGGCANGQCNLQARTQSFIAPQPAQVTVNTPRVAVRVGVQRAYQPLYVVTAPTEVTMEQHYVAPQQYALVSQSPPSSVRAEINTAPQTEFLAVDPSIGSVQVASGCSGGNCGGRGGLLRPFQRLRARAGAKQVNIAKSVQIVN